MSDQSHVYRSSPQGDGMYLYTVGYFEPSGAWYPISDHSDEDEAAQAVHYLNGSPHVHVHCEARIKRLEEELAYFKKWFNRGD